MCININHSITNTYLATLITYIIIYPWVMLHTKKLCAIWMHKNEHLMHAHIAAEWCTEH